jgi:integrase
MGRCMTKIKLPFIHEWINPKTGKVVRYVRRKGYPQVRLYEAPGGAAFMAAYQAALSGDVAPVRRQTLSGTVDNLIERYYGSPKFDNLSGSSKKTYRLVLSRFCENHGARQVAGLTVDKAEKIIADIGAVHPSMANLTRSILSTVFRYAVKLRMRPDNPFGADAIDAYKTGTHHTWTDIELDAYRKRWPVGTRERLAFAVLLYSGQRVSDAVKLKRSDVMVFSQQKTGTALQIPVHPALARAIKAGPSNGIYIIGAKNGRPIKSGALTKLIRAAVKKADLHPRCKAHGLRKAMQRRLAELQATTKQMQAVSGHKSLRETERYSVDANQALLAASAIALLPDES